MTEYEVSVLFWGISGQMPSRCWAHTPPEWLQNGFWEPSGDSYLLGMAAKRLLGAFCRPLPLLQARACSRAEARFKTLIWASFHEPFATAFISEWFTFIVTLGTVTLHLKGLSIRNGFGITPQGPHGPTPPRAPKAPLGPLGPLLGPLALCPGKTGVASLESRKQGTHMRVGGHARSVMNQAWRRLGA